MRLLLNTLLVLLTILIEAPTNTIAAESINGIWHLKGPNSSNMIVETKTGLKARSLKKKKWFHYKKISAQKYRDRKGNVYHFLTSRTARWTSWNKKTIIELTKKVTKKLHEPTVLTDDWLNLKCLGRNCKDLSFKRDGKRGGYLIKNDSQALGAKVKIKFYYQGRRCSNIRHLYVRPKGESFVSTTSQKKARQNGKICKVYSQIHRPEKLPQIIEKIGWFKHENCHDQFDSYKLSQNVCHYLRFKEIRSVADG